MARGKLFLGIILLVNFLSLHAQDDYPVETVVQKGHTDNIDVLRFSRDGNYMVTGSDDLNIKLWDLKTGREIRTFKGHQEPIQDLDINLEEGLIVSSASTAGGSEIKIWDIYTGEPKKTVKGGEALNLFNIEAWEWSSTIRSLALAPDGKTLFWGEDNLGIQVGKISKARSNDKIETDWEPNSIVFSPDGKLFAAGGDAFNRKIDGVSNEVHLYNFPEQSLKQVIQTPNDNINQIIFSSDGKLLACLNTRIIWESEPINTQGIPLTKKKYNNRISVFNLADGDLIYETQIDGWEISSFAFSPNGRFLAIPYSSFDENFVVKTNLLENEVLQIHDVQAKTKFKDIDTGEFLIYSLGFTPDDQILVANGKKINFWSVANWEKIREASAPSKVGSLDVTEDGSIHVTKIDENKTVSLDLNKETLNFLSEEISKYTYYQWINDSYYVSLEGRKLWLNNHNKIYKPREIMDLSSHPEWETITEVAISENMAVLVLRDENKKEVLVKQILSDQPAKILQGHRKNILSMAINPAGNLLATGSDGNKILLWDLKTGQQTHQLLGHNGDILSLAFSPDGTKLASGSDDNSTKIWDVKKGSRIHTLLRNNNTSGILTLDFSDDGSRLVTGSGDFLFGGRSDIYVWDVKKGRKLKVIPGNEGYVSKIVCKGNRIYSIGNDPMVKVHDLETGDLVYSYIPYRKNDFILFTPDNYYMSTKMQYPIVHFVKGLEIYSFDNFDLKYNRPDIILQQLRSSNEKLKNAYASMHERRLKKLGFDESMFNDDFHLPVATIMEKEKISLVNTSGELSFSVEFKDENSGLKNYQVLVNNVPVFGSRGMEFSSSPQAFGKTGTYALENITLQLGDGINRIQVSTFNENGVESHTDNLEVIYQGRESKPKLHLLVVGVSKYLDEGMNLNYAEKDGRDMLEFFQKTNGLYSEVVLHSIFNESVTREEFLKLRDKLLASDVNDHVILFMAGHGLLDESFNFNFAAHDINFNDPASNGISFDMIESVVDGIPARQKLILIDACHSGEIDKIELEERTQEEYARLTQRGNVKSQSFEKLKMNVFKFYGVNSTSIEMMEQLFTDLSNGSGSVIISAAAGDSYALESSEWKNGIFTYSILEGLKDLKADQNQDKSVSVSELKDYVIDQVYILTDGKQKPTSRKENLEFDYSVWK